MNNIANALYNLEAEMDVLKALCCGENKAFSEFYVANDATDSFTEEDYRSGLKYLKEVYGAQLFTVDELISIFHSK